MSTNKKLFNVSNAVILAILIVSTVLISSVFLLQEIVPITNPIVAGKEAVFQLKGNLRQDCSNPTAIVEAYPYPAYAPVYRFVNREVYIGDFKAGQSFSTQVVWKVPTNIPTGNYRVFGELYCGDANLFDSLYEKSIIVAPAGTSSCENSCTSSSPICTSGTTLKRCVTKSDGCLGDEVITCASFCSVGACYGGVQCSAGFIGSKTCDGSTVVQQYRTGANSGSICSEEKRVVEQCSNGCSNSACTITTQNVDTAPIVNQPVTPVLGVCSDTNAVLDSSSNKCFCKTGFVLGSDNVCVVKSVVSTATTTLSTGEGIKTSTSGSTGDVIDGSIACDTLKVNDAITCYFKKSYLYIFGGIIGLLLLLLIVKKTNILSTDSRRR